MKKIFKLFITILMFFTLTSCTSNQTSSNTTIPDSSINKPSTPEVVDPNVGKDTFNGVTYTVYENLPYNSKYEVAIYIHTFKKLPSNYFKKSQRNYAEKNWTKENKYSIGGDHFGNYENRLPSGRSYTECDIDATPKSRGAKRIVFSNKYEVFYTGNHYKSFTQIY